MNKKINAICLATLAALTAPANAEIRINGFASIVAGTTLDEDKSLLSYDDTLSFKPESLFALQASADLGEGLSATAQIISRGENDFDTKFEWAYVSYQATDQTQVSVGRMRIPLYRYSDFLDVGYAYNWVRPPTSVYSLVFSTYDGVSVVNNHTLGDWDSTVQAIYGSFEGGINLLSDSDPSKLQDIMGINWTVGNYWLTARAVYMVADTTISFENDPDPNQTLNSGIALVGNVFPDAADSLIVSDDRGTFFGVGFSVDYNDFLIDSEYIELEVEDSLVAKQEDFYISFGYRMGDWTPIFTFETREETNEDNYSSQLPVTIDITGVGTIPVRASYQAILASQEAKRDVYTIGARYNFHPSAALKMSISTREDKMNDTDATVYSVGVDMVF